MFKTTISNDEINELDILKFPGSIYLIDNDADVVRAIKILSEKTCLGFDTETKPSFKKNQHNDAALLQLASEDEVFLFRLKYLKKLDAVFSLLANPKILKVGVAIKRDIKELKELSRFEPKKFVELQDYVSLFNIENKSLKKLSAIVLNGRVSKRQQRSNWEKKDLTEGQKRYAATDAWASLLIYKRLKESVSSV